jgi:hypothetical protein
VGFAPSRHRIENCNADFAAKSCKPNESVNLAKKKLLL